METLTLSSQNSFNQEGNLKYKAQRWVMQIAHKIKSKCDNFSEALKKAWKCFKLKKALKNNPSIEFYFTKLKGEKRKAVGTTMLSLVPEELQPKGLKPKDISMITYFDLEKNNWRSFNAYQIDIVEPVMVA